MRRVSAKMTAAWKSQAKTGDQRPMVRATIQVQDQKRFEYDTAWATGGSFDVDRHRKGTFTSMVFGDRSGPREIRNIISCQWTRSVEQDVATCELTILNSEISPIGNPDEFNESSVDELEQPGYFTYNRGMKTIAQNRWGYGAGETGWRGVFVPDRVVRTYEGYGSDPSVYPVEDPNLVQSGTWLINTVTYNADGTITLSMKDYGELLLKQICFPPVIPKAEYPLMWSALRSENIPARDAQGGAWEDRLRRWGDATSSNSAYIGQGLTDPPYSSYVNANGSWDGHHPRDALVNAELRWWVSTGQTTQSSKVWWQYDLDDPRAIAAVRLHCIYGPYRAYISVHNGTKWLGKRKIPYTVTTEDIDVGADIPYVASIIADRHDPFDVIFKRVYKNAKKIRITFGHLYDTGIGNYPWRAGLRDMKIYTGDPDSLHFGMGEKLKVVGNYMDYTQIVKWVCAWGGFYWPAHSTGQDFVKLRPGDANQHLFITYPTQDGVLPRGRVWGNFMPSGTAGVADLTVDMFDKKPLMDVINYVRDLLGFLFFIDEQGGVVWRMPNIWTLGNYVTPTTMQEVAATGRRGRARTKDIVTLDEEETLLNYATVLNSDNIRERIFVGNAVGGVGTVIKGFNPFPVGMRRMAGWTDQNFKTKRETRVMADMISARQMFTWKRGKAQIPGYPAIQIDDQIRIFERVTNETYYHYVMGISSSIDLSTGEWTYDLETHWLGEEPSDAWVVDVEELPAATRQYLSAVGYEDTDD